VILKLITRDLFRHKKNTIAVIVLIMIITSIFYLGNSLLAETSEGLRITYNRNYTGDILLTAESDVSMSILGANAPSINEYFSIPVIKNYTEIIDYIEHNKKIKSFTPQLSGMAEADIRGRKYKALLFGIDAASYFKVFRTINVKDGEVLTPGEPGVMISTKIAGHIKRTTGEPVEIGEKIALTVIGPGGLKIRTSTLKGIYTYRRGIPLLDEIMLIDAQTLRALNLVTQVSPVNKDTVTETTDILLDDVDSLFSQESESRDEQDTPGTSLTIEDIQNLLTREEDQPEQIPGGDTWNFIILRLRQGVPGKKMIKEINNDLSSYQVKAVDWRTAAGTPALLVFILNILFNSGFVLLSIAGIVGIVNILLISIFRRTREIGTYRVLGASDGFIRSFIYTESLTISLTAGLLGIGLGYLVISLINAFQIRLTNDILIFLLGKTVINIRNNMTIAGISAAASVVLGLCASIFPVKQALRIEPMEAVVKG
jgi:putative ABC transport system permease protein